MGKKYRRVMSSKKLTRHKLSEAVKCPHCRRLLEPIIGQRVWYYIVCPECGTLWKGDNKGGNR